MGDRFSITLYTPGKLERLTAQDWDILSKAGFPIYVYKPLPAKMRRLATPAHVMTLTPTSRSLSIKGPTLLCTTMKTTPRHRFEVDIQNRVCLFQFYLLTLGTRETHPNVNFSAPGCLSALGLVRFCAVVVSHPGGQNPLRTRAALVLEGFGRKARESIPWTAPLGRLQRCTFQRHTGLEASPQRAHFTPSKAQTHQQFAWTHVRARSRQAHSVFSASSRHVTHH